MGEERVSIPSDSGKFVGMERGKAVAKKSWLLADSEGAVVAVPSPDMVSEPRREPVGVLDDGCKGQCKALEIKGEVSAITLPT